MLAMPSGASAANNISITWSPAPPVSAPVGSTVSGTVLFSNPANSETVSVSINSSGSTGLDNLDPGGAGTPTNIGVISPGGSVTKVVHGRVTVAPNGTAALVINATATPTANTGSPVKNVTLSANIGSTDAVTGALNAQKNVSGSSGERAVYVFPDDQITYSLVLTNNSDSTAAVPTGGVLPVPSGTTLVSRTDGATSLPAHGTTTYQLVVQVNHGLAPDTNIVETPSGWLYSMASPVLTPRGIPITPADYTSTVLLAPPSLTGPVPASPADDEHPTILGSTQDATTVQIYGEGGCAGPMLADLTASQFNAQGYEATVEDGSTTTFSAQAKFGDLVSVCSNDVVYHDLPTPPQTTITQGPPSTGNTPGVSFSFTSDDPAATFSCRLDAGAYQPCSSPSALPALADGTHTFSVRATDVHGATDPTPATRTFKIDTHAPRTVIKSAKVKRSGKAKVSFAADEAGVTFECSLDGKEPKPCTSPAKFKLKKGKHKFKVVATDAAGNVDPIGATARLKFKG
jgi:hypothetical protein